MKKTSILAISMFLWVISLNTFAYTEHNVESANFIAAKWVINDNSSSVLNYNLDYNITRREMLKVMMNLSGKTVTDTCTGKFSDMNGSDWGCKYAEAALENWYIAANTTFRPNDNVTQIESLKMIMQAKSLERDANDDWRAGYVSKAQSSGILDQSYMEYDELGVRWWIFSNAARTYSDFNFDVPEIELTPEEEELFQFLLDL